MPANKTLPCSCDSTFGKKTELLVPPSVALNKNTRTTLHIQNGRTQPPHIGLNVNTKVHIRPKKGPDYRDNAIFILVCLLIGQIILNYFNSQELRSQLKETEKRLNVLEQTVISVSTLFEEIEEKVKHLEHGYINKSMIRNNEHFVSKRDVEPLISCSNCTYTTRQTRSVTRGPFAVHLRGAMPEISVRDGGIISPWYIDKTSSGTFLLVDGVVGEGRGIIEIVEEGLYFIYAQMYYLTSSSLNSYSINLQLGEGNGREDMVVAMCSAEAATNKLSELSCFTAVVRYLHMGDRIYVTQRERNRRIIFRDNKSFLGLTLLNSPHSLTQ